MAEIGRGRQVYTAVVAALLLAGGTCPAAMIPSTLWDRSTSAKIGSTGANSFHIITDEMELVQILRIVLLP